MSLTDIATGLVRRGRRLPDDPADENVGPLGGRRSVVTADDGVELHVEVHEVSKQAGSNGKASLNGKTGSSKKAGSNGAGSDTAESVVTIVFCHGYMLDSTSWRVHHAMLVGKVRMVFWDLRGHGRSGWGTPPNATIDQLGKDLYAVLEATTPSGPVVLVGHSMGGMAILGLAESHPEMFGDRVVGVLLAGTSAGGLSTVTVGLPPLAARLLHRMVPVTLETLRRQARLVDAVRRPIGSVTYLLALPYLFGARVPRPVAQLTTRSMASVPIQVIAEFYTELIGYDKHTALPALARVPVVVAVGDHDLITPLEHARELVAAIRSAELVVIPGAGHLLVLERPAEITSLLHDLVDQVGAAWPAAEPSAAVGTAARSAVRLSRPGRARPSAAGGSARRTGQGHRR